MLCCCDYSEGVLDSFAHQIQSEYFGVNRSVSIEGISLEHFSALPKLGINASIKSYPRHEVFHSFFSDDSKKYSATTTAHRKCLIKMLKERNLLKSSLSIILKK